MKTLILTCMFFSSISVHATIKIKFNNQMSKSVNVRIVQGEQALPEENYEEIYTTTISANSTTPEFIKIPDGKKGKNIIVLGTVQGIVNTLKFKKHTITQKKEEIIITLDYNAQELPADESSYSEMLQALNFSPPKNTRLNMNVADAYRNYFGGIVLRKDSTEIARLEPTVLKAENIPIRYNSGDRSFSTYFTSSFLAKAKGEIPGAASIGVDGNSKQVFKLTYTLEDYGPISWNTVNGKSIATLFSELNDVDKIPLIKRYLVDTSLRMYQYDQMYVFREMDIEINKMKSQSGTIDVTVPMFFSGGAGYQKEEGEASHEEFKEMTLNIWASKDITYVLQEEAARYLEKTKTIVNNSSSTKDAQNILKATFSAQELSTINVDTSDTKSEIMNGIEKAANLIREKESTTFEM